MPFLHIGLFLSTLLVTISLIPITMIFLKKFGFWNAMDNMHEKTVVRGGGIAIAVAFVSCGISGGIIGNNYICDELLYTLPAILLLLITGIIDDRFGLRPKMKLLLQSLSIIFLWCTGFRINIIFYWELPWFLSLIATWFWGISILNAFNLIDGLDGLCAGNALIVSATFCFLAILTGNSAVQTISILLIGCCLGFLFYNFHPAKLFLGDTGSLFLGLISTVLSLQYTAGHFSMNSIAILLFIFWIPFCDTGLAIWRRKVKSRLKKSGGTIMERDRYHLHYRLLEAIHSHTATVIIMWMGMILIDIFALLIFKYATSQFTLSCLVILGVFSLTILAQYELRYSYCLFKHTLVRKFLSNM